MSIEYNSKVRRLGITLLPIQLPTYFKNYF